MIHNRALPKEAPYCFYGYFMLKRTIRVAQMLYILLWKILHVILQCHHIFSEIGYNNCRNTIQILFILYHECVGNPICYSPSVIIN